MYEHSHMLPTHPWRQRLEHLTEGKGNFYHYGPSYTVDPIVLGNSADPMILLIKRNDTGEYALPGGFIDEGEDPTQAGLRELEEETSLLITDVSPMHVYEGPVDDPRSTLHAWPETTALLWRTEVVDVLAADDASDAQWFLLNDIPKNLYGSHRLLIDMAITNHGTLLEKLLYFGDHATIRTASGGHMGYERSIIDLSGNQSIFVKKHTSERFTDPIRERNSRAYLQKEFSTYRQLSPQTNYVGKHHYLVEDHTLLLDAYDPQAGWHWRAPMDKELRKRYIDEIFHALKEVETLRYQEETAITSSSMTFRKEGWDMFLSHQAKIYEALSTSKIAGSDKLLTSLTRLQQAYQLILPEKEEAFSHGDLRQSNITWHPNEGVRIVDWSWAGKSRKGLDTTSFLIDLAKSGIPVDDYMSYFDQKHAIFLIGFWLYHSTWPTSFSGDTVRTQQIASAVAAFCLLEKSNWQL